jgi:chemosensory pili system protein ChpA (sensor histidine kinase/response regulator)
LSQPAEQAEQDEPARLWLHVRAGGNEVTIEVGFSMAVGGSGLDEVQEAIRRLNGSISARRNTLGGISFYLRLPRSQGSIHGLLVRVGSHRVVVPFSHIQRINDGKESPLQGREIDSNPAELPSNLNSLLGFPSAPTSTTIRPVLILQPGLASQAVQVDEVLGDVKLVVKPLAPHLRRRGITGAAIDGMGNVLLMVDLPELLRRQGKWQAPAEATERDEKHSPGQTQKSILIADDSVYMRQSVLQTLSSAGYRVATARDGREAFELLSANPPHVLLLDLEMPILNGYDLLNIIRVHAELAQVKIVMLTSRSSEKHQERARELGAHAYLTKPCPQETLLEMISSLLAG